MKDAWALWHVLMKHLSSRKPETSSAKEARASWAMMTALLNNTGL
jgi:hypothetical protein